ncbi:hypothetical protein [Streptomyces alboniger]|uniref:hypothetical protein n=1 Tax=Streptomyces alboniger TaxID=132473 RepID=UPI0006E2AAE1|nr:hypothetical protein [Streptomyces alboniger]
MRKRGCQNWSVAGRPGRPRRRPEALLGDRGAGDVVVVLVLPELAQEGLGGGRDRRQEAGGLRVDVGQRRGDHVDGFPRVLGGRRGEGLDSTASQYARVVVDLRLGDVPRLLHALPALPGTTKGP